MTPYWKAFLKEHGLSADEFEWEVKSGAVVYQRQIRLLSVEESRIETKETHPGVIVSQDGFRAVADDLCPSGDLYFINEADGVGGPLYKIHHDSVSEKGYARDEAVAVVLQDYRELLKYRRP